MAWKTVAPLRSVELIDPISPFWGRMQILGQEPSECGRREAAEVPSVQGGGA